MKELRRDFKVGVFALDGGCIAHDDESDCVGVLQAHHVITQQQLRKAGRGDLLWDVANGASVCEDAHRRHTLAVERIKRDRLPARCVEFANAYGFNDILDRFYA